MKKVVLVAHSKCGATSEPVYDDSHRTTQNEYFCNWCAAHFPGRDREILIPEQDL